MDGRNAGKKIARDMVDAMAAMRRVLRERAVGDRSEARDRRYCRPDQPVPLSGIIAPKSQRGSAAALALI